MFVKQRVFGQHTVYAYDTTRHGFMEFFRDLYKTDQLNHLGLDLCGENLCDIETELHKTFYTEIKTNGRFKQLYCSLIQDIFREFFGDEEVLLYQSFPSVRFQFVNNVAVPPHYDSDDLGRHPVGEWNFLLPITEMTGTKRLFIESEPGKGDYAGIDMEYGELLYFNGNRCTHYNQVNTEGTIRISLDFRVITLADYMAYIRSGQITSTNPRDPDKKRVPVKMTIGGYYQIVGRDEPLESMMRWHFQRDLILQTQPNFDVAEAQACYDYLKDGTNFIMEFKKTEELEGLLCDYIGCKHAIMTTSGNMALILALMAYEFAPGDEIIVPNYTMIATINSIKMAGATPVIVDVDPTTLTMGVEQIARARTSQTRAVMHVSLNNRHRDIAGIAAYCKEHGLVLIEDAAQSLGCFTAGGAHLGTFGDVGCFSLSTPKIISTGQGGFMVTNNDEIARRMRMIKNFGRKSGGVDVFEVFGINAKFTDVQAVIGIEQMKKLPGRVKRMREIFDLYYKHLAEFMIAPEWDSWIPWFVDIFVEHRDELMEFLKAHNIQTRPTYPEIHRTPMYAATSGGLDLPVSMFVSANGLFLPSHTLLTDDQILYICRVINAFYISSISNMLAPMRRTSGT
jgi:perosamine synthetase